MTIKHFVFSGGGPTIMTLYGVLKYLNQQNFYDLNNIKSIHATSSGAIIAVLILLSDNWDVLEDYILKRPWDKLFNIEPINLLNLWQKKGILDDEIYKAILKPFLQVKDFEENITLKDFYEKNNVEIYIYVTNINSKEFESISLSYKTHPSLELYKAIAMSGAVPLLFMPMYDNNKCYIDGGILNNYPLNECIHLNNNMDEILGIKIINNETFEDVNDETILPNYLYNIINKMQMQMNLQKQKTYKDVIHTVNCYIENNGFISWNNSLYDISLRKEYIEVGITSAKNFLNNLESKS